MLDNDEARGSFGLEQDSDVSRPAYREAAQVSEAEVRMDHP